MLVGLPRDQWSLATRLDWDYCPSTGQVGARCRNRRQRWHGTSHPAERTFGVTDKFGWRITPRAIVSGESPWRADAGSPAARQAHTICQGSVVSLGERSKPMADPLGDRRKLLTVLQMRDLDILSSHAVFGHQDDKSASGSRPLNNRVNNPNMTMIAMFPIAISLFHLEHLVSVLHRSRTFRGFA